MKNQVLIRLFISTFFLSSALHAVETNNLLEGRYEYRTDTESLEIRGKQVCFFPSKSSSKSIPRPSGDYRFPWFCFKNSEQSAHLFGFSINQNSNKCGFEGNAKIKISNYIRYDGEGDANDIATLDAVLKNTNPHTISCSN